MLPQNCSRIHYPISMNESLHKSQMNEKSIYNNTLNICCFDYLIDIEEFYSDNLLQNYFYYQFTKNVYYFDKNNILDYSSYNKDSLLKFILILNKACCYYYIREKIKYSKFLSNLSVRIIKTYFKNNTIGCNGNLNNKISKKNNNNILIDLKNNNIVSNIYNNACCNYFKTLSYNKCLKFLEYSNKNNEENDINNKLIYYNNALIISSKNQFNNNIENFIQMINKLILSKRKYFDNIYCTNNYYNNDENFNNNSLKNNLKKNEEHYNSFKLLSFIMYNYGLAVEKLLKQKKKAKKYYQNSYEYISKYLGKNSLEAQKFMFKIKYKKNSKNEFQNNNFFPLYNIKDKESFIMDENKKRNLTPTFLKGKNDKNIENNINENDNDNDIEITLKNIMKKIENFEEILKNNEVLNQIILREQNLNNNSIENKSSNELQKTNNDNNDEKDTLNNKNKINQNLSSDNIYSYNQKEDINNIKEINLGNNNKNNNNNINIEKKQENTKNDVNIEEKNNTENKKKINEKEKITFAMMDNIIEEFKRESQEKMEKQKKLKEEMEKEKKLKEENEKKEDKEKKSGKNQFKVIIDKAEDNKNDTQPKKPLKLKKLFQKVIGMKEKEPPKTKLGELFQSLMKNSQEERKKGMDEGGKEIKVGQEKNNNFINLDDDEEEVKDNDNNIQKEDNNYSNINKDNSNNKPKSGFGYMINVNLDNTDYSYNATTFYQKSNPSE